MKKKSKENFLYPENGRTALISIKDASAISGLPEAYLRKLVKHNRIAHFRNREARSKIFLFRADFERLIGTAPEGKNNA